MMSRVHLAALTTLGVAWAILAARPMSAAERVALAAFADEKGFDVKKLQGRWRVTHFYDHGADGKKVDLATGPIRFSVAIRKTLVIEFNGSGLFEYDIKYDLTKTPVWIDLTLKNQPELKTHLKGVLELKGDKLKIHFACAPRPTNFKLKKALDSTLFICERVKE
jgi:uncharacterized protein (TIGR03067 family)